MEPAFDATGAAIRIAKASAFRRIRESSQTFPAGHKKPPLDRLERAAGRKIRLPGQLRRHGPVSAQAFALAEPAEVAPDQAGIPAEDLQLAFALHRLAQAG